MTLRVTSDRIAQQTAALDAAKRYLGIATAGYETGLDPYVAVMTTETLLLSTHQALVVTRGERAGGGGAADEALGGGWDHAHLPAVD